MTGTATIVLKKTDVLLKMTIITEALNVPNWHIENHGGKALLFVSETGLYVLRLRIYRRGWR